MIYLRQKSPSFLMPFAPSLYSYNYAFRIIFVNKKHIDIVYMFSYCCTMKIDYSLHGILFEWDSNKSETNLRKHGIAFENACEVFKA